METREDLDRRCPKLGGPVPFKYCMACNEKQPCFKIVDCWWEYFDVVAYLEEKLGEDQFARLVSTKPAPKVQSLVELIANAKNRNES